MNSGDRGSNFILITRVHSTFYPHMLVFFIVLVNFVLLCDVSLFMSFFLVFFFFSFCFWGVCIDRQRFVHGMFWVGNKRRKNKQNRTFSH